MRLSDLTGKEVINLGDGGRLGYIDECDLVFEGHTGRISALIVPKRGWLSAFLGDGKTTSIPWHNIKRIGEEVIIVDLNNVYDRMYSIFRTNEKG